MFMVCETTLYDGVMKVCLESSDHAFLSHPLLLSGRKLKGEGVMVELPQISWAIWGGEAPVRAQVRAVTTHSSTANSFRRHVKVDVSNVVAQPCCPMVLIIW